MMIFGLLLVVGIIYFLFKDKKELGFREEETPLELLQKQFVNGEIDKDDYTRKYEILTKGK